MSMPARRASLPLLRRLLLLAALAVLAACAPSGRRPEPQPQPQAQPEWRDVEARVAELTNRFRRQMGVAPLRVDPTLSAVAHRHAAAMGSRDRYGDTGDNGHVLDGKTFEDRARAGGYVWAALAENVGTLWGHADPATDMVEKWKQSPGHRANMLSDRVTEIGLGAAVSSAGHWYMVQVFGRPRAGN